MTTLKKLIFLSILSFLMIGPLISQDSIMEGNKQEQEIRYPNIIKINTLALPFSNISLSYERGIKPKFSAGIGLGYKYAGVEPKMFSVDNSTITVAIDNISGFSVTPDVRYYIRACDPEKLDGFYAGVYFRYTNYSSEANFAYLPEGSPLENYNADIKMNEYGVGIQLGYQFIFWERFSVDLLIVGPRISRYHFAYEFDQQPSEEFLSDLSEYMNEVVDRFGLDYDVDVKQQGESSASTSFSFVNSRFGLSLGFAF